MAEGTALPEVVLFDLGGTLIELSPVPMIERLAKTVDPEIDPDTLGEAFGHVLGSTAEPTDGLSLGEHVQKWSEVYRRVLGFAGYTGDVEAAVEAIWSLWLDAGVLYPDACEVLQTLRTHGHKLGVISNWAPPLEESLVRLGIRDHFDVVICSSLVGSRKPDPNIFLAAVEGLNVSPDRCAYVGDSVPLDVEGAHGVGMVPILIAYGADATCPGSNDRERASYRVIGSLSELVL